VRQQLEEQVVRIEKTKVAVSAFVPRFFLQKMGYTSIIQVTAGDATNVALAMLFSDIRRFTTVSEGMSSADLFDWVQGYFKRMTTIVDNRKGNVNQFVGDALFAVFSMSHDAIQCAVDMHTDVEQLNVLRRRVDQQTTPIEVGVGIHHDVVALGILGDDKRHTCTAISASVNLASRLEGLTKQLGCKIIASEAAVEQLTAGQAAATRKRCLGAVQVKGSQAGVVVYDVFHADAAAAQQYKEATRDAFEVVARLCHTRGAADPFIARVREALRAYVREARSFAPDGSASNTTTASDQPPSTEATAIPSADASILMAQNTVALPTHHPNSTGDDEQRDRASLLMEGHLHHDEEISLDARNGERLAIILRGLARYSFRDIALELFANNADGSGRHSFLDK
jgi:class 3 adenylate cyclase